MSTPDTAVRHSVQVYYRRRIRDFCRKSWWVECIRCGQVRGPFPDRGFARFVQASLWGTFGEGAWCERAPEPDPLRGPHIVLNPNGGPGVTIDG